MKRFYAVALFTLSMFACNADEWYFDKIAADNAAPEKGNAMASPVTAADYGGSLPIASIQCPNDTDPVVGADIRGPVAALLAETDDIRSITTGLENDKVDRAGDTMTDSLTVNASTTNNDGIIGTGNGSGFGIKGIGGATGGGGRFVGTGNGSMGVSAVGGPSNGSGIVATGGAGGLAAELYPGTAATATVPQMGVYTEGFLKLAGPDPNSNVDPGANNALHGANITKSWVTFDNTYAILDGYNIASITHVLGSIYAVTFVRPMANANYGVKIHVHGAPGYSGAHNGTKTTTGFQFVLYKTDTLALGFGTATEAYIEVMGRQ